MSEHLDALEALLAAGAGEGADLETLVEDGQSVFAGLQALVHGERPQAGFSNRKVTGWLVSAQQKRVTIDGATGAAKVDEGTDPEPVSEPSRPQPSPVEETPTPARDESGGLACPKCGTVFRNRRLYRHHMATEH
ncbi:MAG: C2H2-type zinc finger protein [Solirubrobacterales bacterium]